MPLTTAPRSAGRPSAGVHVGTVTRITADGPYVELRRVAAGFEFGPVLTAVPDLAVGDPIVAMPLASDPDSFVVLGRHSGPPPPPTEHDHDGAYAPLGHNHDGTYAAAGHTHDDRYFTEAETTTAIDTAINTKTLREVGEIIPWAGQGSPPSGWLLCNGAAVSRTTYADLFAKIGTQFGAGDGSTTFAVPQLNDDRFPMGGATVGATGGAKTVALTIAQMPSHAHTASTGYGWTPFLRQVYASGAQSVGYSNHIAAAGSASFSDAANTAAFNGGQHTHGIPYEGGGAAHENMPPYVTVRYLIRAYAVATVPGSSPAGHTHPTDDTGWQTPTLLSGWQHYGSIYPPARYRRRDGIVNLRGLIRSGTIGQRIMTLPAGYRPPYELIFSVASNNAYGEVRVATNGDVVPVIGNNGWVSLDGLHFHTD